MRGLITLLAVFAAPIALELPSRAAERHGVSGDDKAGIGLAMRRGSLIYAYDRVAWLGTDDMLGKLKDTSKVGGWLVDGPAEAPTLVFFDKDPVQPSILYSARFSHGKLIESHLLVEGSDRSLSPSRKALANAIKAARQSLVEANVMRCADKPFNTVALPPERPGDPISIYFLTPQTKSGSWPMGGHYVVEVAEDGTAKPPRPFTRACLEMTQPKGAKGEPAAMVVSNVLGPVPTEIQVFSSFASGLPIFVATTANNRLWRVNRNTIMEAGELDR